MSDRNKATPASYLVLKRKNKIFLMRRAGTHYFNGYYSLPAGHVEAGELPTEAMVREAKEEVGLKISKKDLRIMNIMYRTAHDSTGDRADYFFILEKFKGEPKVCEPEKCDDAKWVDMNKLPAKTTPEVRLALAHFKKKSVFSEMPFNKKNLNPEENV